MSCSNSQTTVGERTKTNSWPCWTIELHPWMASIFPLHSCLDLTPTCTASSRLASLRCAHAMQTSWLQTTYCSTVDYMMLWGGTCGLNRRYWGTSSMATWRSWGGQPPSWGQQASPSSVRQRRRRQLFMGQRPRNKCPTPRSLFARAYDSQDIK